MDGPIPGNSSNCSKLAEFKEIFCFWETFFLGMTTTSLSLISFAKEIEDVSAWSVRPPACVIKSLIVPSHFKVYTPGCSTSPFISHCFVVGETRSSETGV